MCGTKSNTQSIFGEETLNEWMRQANLLHFQSWEINQVNIKFYDTP